METRQRPIRLKVVLPLIVLLVASLAVESAVLANWDQPDTFVITPRTELSALAPANMDSDITLLAAPAILTSIPTPTPEPTATQTRTQTPTPFSTPIPTQKPTNILTIAAHDSPDPNEADFLCDGIDDQIEIQAALDELESYGGEKLLFSNGTYSLSPAGNGEYCLLLPSNITLEGEETSSREEVRLVSIGDPLSGMFQSKDFYPYDPWPGISNVTFRNMTIDAGDPTGWYREWWAGGFKSNCFYIFRMIVDGLTVDDVIFVHNASGTTVSEISLHHSDNVTITNTLFDKVTTHIANYEDLNEVTNTGAFVFTGNTMLDAPRIASNTFMDNFTISDNIFQGCNYTNIDVGLGSNGVIQRNQIYDGKHMGIYSESGNNITINNNHIESIGHHVGWTTDGEAIRIANIRYKDSAGHITIGNNTIKDCGRGIEVDGVPYVTIHNNDIANIEAHGVVIGFSKGTAEGTRFYNGTPMFADHCIVKSNTILNFGHNYHWSFGIMISDAMNTLVEGNIIEGRGNTGALYGIREFFTADAAVNFWDSSDRPDFNVIRENMIAGVGSSIVQRGTNTHID